jgi:hypothetical protein
MGFMLMLDFICGTSEGVYGLFVLLEKRYNSIMVVISSLTVKYNEMDIIRPKDTFTNT